MNKNQKENLWQSISALVTFTLVPTIRYLTFFIFVLRIMWAIDVLYTPNVFGFLFSGYILHSVKRLSWLSSSSLLVILLLPVRFIFFFGEKSSWRHTETEKATSRRLLSLVS